MKITQPSGGLVATLMARFKERRPDLELELLGYLKVTGSAITTTLTLVLKHEHRTVAQNTITTMPGCCGVLISTGLLVHDRRKGYARLLHDVQDAIADYYGVGSMICTTHADNEAEIGLLRACDWTQRSTFRNGRTGNLLALWSKEYSRSVYSRVKED